jgi:hypothetical protein
MASGSSGRRGCAWGDADCAAAVEPAAGAVPGGGADISAAFPGADVGAAAGGAATRATSGNVGCGAEWAARSEMRWMTPVATDLARRFW